MQNLDEAIALGAAALDRQYREAADTPLDNAVAVPGADVDVKLCQMCKGSGVEVEHYNHRVLERSCDYCEGQGTLVTKNGIVQRSTTEDRNKATHRFPAGTEDADGAKGDTERKYQLRKNLSRIQKALDGKQKELQGLIQLQVSSDLSSEQQEATAEIVAILRKQIADMEKQSRAHTDKLSMYERTS